ncbi:phenylalanine--tRNA ligase subunit alpha [Anaerobranca gottschalkii]|uniref:Phenylalanine--tRNA ligase alpha subunit n=1 Tax=Anaerobranca gottschalkii DSM 13577 TaxID=1120990 RepID=A0A1H9Z457_9FIRM|nr:phenylalanine--tRNA ligase subunit alpha [Anaerobranca gottschalkii]SES76299.1 phenylalanyl-tRNA synthetase, alpha subunit [Anaerobranca gottschalkii DSM 13577]
MKEKLSGLLSTALEKIKGAERIEELEGYKVQYLGKKGELTGILRGMGSLAPEERPIIGQIANEVKEQIQRAIEEKIFILEEKLLEDRLQRETIDISLPGLKREIGALHPLTIVRREIEQIFMSMGYEIVEGPEIETDYYNFEALNLPPNHPARDMQDTFYITENILLRTHTSPVQARTMEKRAEAIPLKIISPGRVFRKDDDATHSPMFHQVEGLVIDKNITLGDLKGTLLLFAKEMFGEKQKVRLRPSFFPFTEPSAEVDISCFLCEGKGCSLCSNTGWIEILGAGMVHPNVLRAGGYNPDEVQGFAFGMGVERITMLKYGISDIRELFNGDLRVVKQFARG